MERAVFVFIFKTDYISMKIQCFFHTLLQISHVVSMLCDDGAYFSIQKPDTAIKQFMAEKKQSFLFFFPKRGQIIFKTSPREKLFKRPKKGSSSSSKNLHFFLE